MTDDKKKEHEKNVKGKNLTEAREYLRQHRIRNTWVMMHPGAELVVEVKDRINMVIDHQTTVVKSSYWG